MGYIVGFKSYEIKQENAHRGNLCVTFGFEADETVDINDFPPAKYAEFMAKLSEVIKEYNGGKPECILG